MDESEKEKQWQAEQETFLALTEGRLKDACLSMASFEASRVFPRGLGIDWQKYDCNRDLTILQLVFTTHLKRLASFDENTILRLRVVASMMHLWGTNKPYMPSPWLPTDGRDWSIELKMLSTSALNAVNLQEMKRAGIKQVQVLASGLLGICYTCRSENGKIYPIDTAPILPHETCRCKMGCSCELIAVERGEEEFPDMAPIGL